ncbi:MAG: hypothetical protein COA79_13995 [Planctomycetota bacterium]|nr:MAG: hypothetical protein COA79_13995 [Planctomycetota bacterium]
MIKIIYTTIFYFVLTLGGRSQELHEDIKVIKKKYLYDLIGDGLSEQEKNNILEKALKHSQEIKPDGSWGDIDYKSKRIASWPATGHLFNLKRMAQGYHLTQTHKTLIRNKFLLGLRHWLSKDYQSKNWYNQRLRIPHILGLVSLLMHDSLTKEENLKIYNLIKKRSALGQRARVETGANLLMFTRNNILCGILGNSPKLIKRAVVSAMSVVKTTKEEGLQSDNTFHQHGPCLHITSYGSGFSYNVSKIIWLTNGTQFEVPKNKSKLLSDFILKGQRWFFRGINPDYMCEGRSIIRTKIGFSKNMNLIKASKFMAMADPSKKELFTDFAMSLEGDSKKEGKFQGNKMFWDSAMMVHRRKDFYISVKMLAYDMLSADMTNFESNKAHYLSDGAMCIMKSGDEYRNIFPLWQWRFIPGATVETGTPKLIWKTVRTFGVRHFVGGVTNSKNGVASMNFSRGSQDGKKSGYGYQRINKNKISISAKKSWFFFDDEIICLGSAIIGRSGKPVTTTINQCYLKGTPKSSKKTDKTQWVHHDGIGYFFHGKQKISMKAEKRSGSWFNISISGKKDKITGELFRLWIDHGNSPENESYAYSLLPNIKSDKMASYKSNIKILQNTKAVQAVESFDKKLIGIVFHKPGKISLTNKINLTSSEACILLLEMIDNKIMKIFLSRPHKLKEGKTILLKINDQTVTFDLSKKIDRSISKTIEYILK